MRAFPVVAPLPMGEPDLRVGQGKKPVLIQAFVPQLAVEAFDMTVLNGFARLDERERDASVGRPRVKGPRAELAAIVEEETYRSAPLDDDGLQGSDHGVTRQTERSRQRQALPRAHIHGRQAAKAPSGAQRIAHKVDRPRIVRGGTGRSRHARDREPFPPPPPHGEAFEAIEALDAFVGMDFAPAAQLPVQTRTAPPRMLSRQRAQLGAQRRIARGPLRGVPHSGPFKAQEATGASLAEPEAPLYVADDRAAPRGRQAPFPSTSLSTWRLRA